MKILFFTEGGSQIGMGHITRSTSLLEEFHSQGITAKLFVNEKSETHLSGADVVIVDSYLAPLDFYRLVSEKARVALFIDDFKRLEYPAGIVVNYSVGAESLGYPVRAGVQYLLGAPYALVRPQFKLESERFFSEGLKTIMVMFGGSDLRNLTVPMIQKIKAAFPSSVLKVIVGAGSKNRTEVESLKNKSIDVLYDPRVETLVDTMARSDAAVSAGGQTLFEMATMGLPGAAVCVADNQINNINGFVKAGFLDNAGNWDSPSLYDDVIASLKSLENATVRKMKSRSGQQLIDGKGSRRIVDYILEKLKIENTVSDK